MEDLARSVNAGRDNHQHCEAFANGSRVPTPRWSNCLDNLKLTQLSDRENTDTC
jgi:hypothetical protein